MIILIHRGYEAINIAGRGITFFSSKLSQVSSSLSTELTFKAGHRWGLSGYQKNTGVARRSWRLGYYEGHMEVFINGGPPKWMIHSEKGWKRHEMIRSTSISGNLHMRCKEPTLTRRHTCSPEAVENQIPGQKLKFDETEGFALVLVRGFIGSHSKSHRMTLWFLHCK